MNVLAIAGKESKIVQTALCLMLSILKDTLWVLRRDEPLVHVSVDILLITKHYLGSCYIIRKLRSVAIYCSQLSKSILPDIIDI